MFSTHVRKRSLLTDGLNSEIYMLVSCGLMKSDSCFDREVHVNVLYVPITTEPTWKMREVCGMKHRRVHPCTLILATYTKIAKC